MSLQLTPTTSPPVPKIFIPTALESPYFDVKEEIAVTPHEAALYAFEVRHSDIVDVFKYIISLDRPGRPVLSMPAGLCSVRRAIVASKALNPVHIESIDSVDLANEANPHKEPQIRLLLSNKRIWDGNEPIGWYYCKAKPDQMELFQADKTKFEQEQTNSTLELAAVQEIISMHNRRILKEESGIRIYDDSLYRTTVRFNEWYLTISLNEGQLRITWERNLGPDLETSLVLSVGEKI